MEAERKADCERHHIRVSGDLQLLLTRGAVEALMGLSYPNARDAHADVVLGALRAERSRLATNSAASTSDAAEYRLPLEYVVRAEVAGEAHESRFVVLRVGSELPPADKVTIPRGATNEWDEVVATRSFEKKTGPSLVLTANAVNQYTENGRLRLRSEQIEGTDARGIGHSWQNADALTTRRIGAVSMSDVEIPGGAKGPRRPDAARHRRPRAQRVDRRVRRSRPDSRCRDSRGRGKVFAQRRITEYQSELLKREDAAELRVGRKSSMQFAYDGAGRPTMTIEAGTYIATSGFDEAGNLLTSTPPGMTEVRSHYDSRGLETRARCPAA